MNYPLAVSGPCFLILNLTAGASEARFKLALVEPDIRAGQVLEIATRKTEIAGRTNTVKGELDTTNTYHTLDFKGRFKIISWDESWEISRTEIRVEHLLAGDQSTTNALLEPGTVVICNFVRGDAFYKLPKGVLAANANAALEQMASFGPGWTNMHRESKAMRLTEPRKVGELWEGDPSPAAYDLEKMLGERPDPKNITMSAHFNQVTNFFGIDCFDLEEHFRVATACPKYRPLFRVYPLAQNPRIEIELTHRHIRPFDRGLPYFSSNSFSTRVSAEADEGRVTIRLYMSGTECIEVKLLSTSGGGADELP
jgi:hypothetical protein